MINIIGTYATVSVSEVEHILEFMKQAWLHGFPVVRKQDGRTEEQLIAHAAILLLVLTGCIAREEENEAGIIVQIKKDIKRGGRLTLDAIDFLEQARSPERYTRRAVLSRKNKKAKA